MLKKLCLIIILLNISVAQHGAKNTNQSSKPKNLTIWTPTSQKMIYNQTNSSQFEKIEDQFDNLRTKLCMCDEQCSIYDDCCPNSKFVGRGKRDEKFSCMSTPHDGYIYMVYKCPLHYKDLEIIHNCETTDKTDLMSDTLLYTPVTSKTKNITFKNVFCAICHEEMHFEFWDIALHYKLTNNRNVKIIPQNLPILRSDFQATTLDLLLCNLRSTQNDGKLISKIYGSYYECDLKIKMPARLNDIKRYCNLRNQSNIKRENSLSEYSNSQNTSKKNPNSFEINLNNSLLPKPIHCVDIPYNSEIYRTICSQKTNFFPRNKDRNNEYCFFTTLDGKPCMLNVWLKEIDDFYYVDNETIFVKKYNSKFTPDQWVREIDNENEIFLCGTEIPISDERKSYSKANYMITNILVKFSIFFLIVHLIWNATDNKLQSLPNKIMYSYSSTLLVIFIFWDMEERLPSCQILAILIHYLSLCCFTWLLIASYDCWLVICHSSAKFQTFARKSRLKRYLVYCFWGWGSPLSLLAIALYFEFAPNTKIPCYLKPGYGRLKQCFVAQETPLNYFYHYPTAVITCLNISFFLHTFYHIFKNKRKDITSTIQNTNSYVIFVRLSLNMGIVAFMILLWALYILVVKTDFVLFHTIQNIFQAAQGIFMFLLFSLDKNMIKKLSPSS